MTQALLWLDDEGGRLWLRRHLRWYASQSFTWDKLIKTPLLLPARAEVSILTALSGERIIFDALPNMKPWHRYAMIIRKLATHFSDTPYIAGAIQGRLNSLQSRFFGIALPRDGLDSILTHLQMAQAACKEIIPAAHLFTRLVQKKRINKVLCLVLYRRMHCYFINEMGLQLLRTIALPIDGHLLGEEVKKLYRYMLGQKWLNVGELLLVRCQIMTKALSVQDLPVLEMIQWQLEQTPMRWPALWQAYRKGMNCAPAFLQRAYLWRYWNRFAWYGVGIMACSITVVGASTFFEYLHLQQRLQQIQVHTKAITQDKKVLGKSAQTLLAIDAYRQKHAQPDYEEILLRLSHVLADFSLWHLDSLEWQRQAPQKMQLLGKWQYNADVEQMTARFERAFMRQLQAKQVRLKFVNQELQQMRVEIYFDMPVEEG